jgi:hypothetical protein
MGLLKLSGAPRAAQSHGAVEVRNRFARQALRKIASDLGIELTDLPLVLAACENDYNNSTVRCVSGRLTFPALRVFGQSTSAFRNVFADTPASSSHENATVRLAEQARAIWHQLACDTKLRKALRMPAPTCAYSDFSTGQLVYYYDQSKGGKRWRGPAVVVGCNVVSKYLHLDHAGNLLHAHYSYVRPCSDGDFLREQLDNSLSSYGQGDPTETPNSPRFHSAFEVDAKVVDAGMPQHMLGKASHGASGLRTPSANSKSSTTSNASNTVSPTTAQKRTVSDCPGCLNPHATHRKTCPHSRVRGRQLREDKEEQKAIVRKEKEKEKENKRKSTSLPPTPVAKPPRTTSAATRTPSAKSFKERQMEKAAKGTANLSRWYGSKDRSEVAAVNVVDITVGDTVKFCDTSSGDFTKHLSIVNEIKGDFVKLKGESLLKSKILHISNCTKVRVVRDGTGRKFGVLPDKDTTSYQNQEKLVSSRQTALEKQALLGDSAEVREIAQILAGSRPLEELPSGKCLFDERVCHEGLDAESTDSGYESDTTSCCSDISETFSSASNNHSTVKNVRNVTTSSGNIQITIPSSVGSGAEPLPARKYTQAHEASDILFEQLPISMQEQAYVAALEDFEISKVWKPAGTLREWKALRRQQQSTNRGPKVTIMDSVWVCKATVDEGAALTSESKLGGLRGKVRLAPRGFREKDISRSEVASPTINPVTMRIVEALCLQLRDLESLIPLKIDFKRAFFQIGIPIDGSVKRIGLVLPKECQGGRTGDDRLIMELLFEVPGTKGAPRDWFLTISSVFVKQLGFSQSRIDPCLFTRHAKGKLVAALCIHVDDSRCWINKSYVDWFRKSLKNANIETRYVQEIELDEPSDMVGLSWLTQESGTFLSQKNYIEKTLKPISLDKIPKNEYTVAGSIKPGTKIYAQFRQRLGQLIWLEKTRIEFSFDISILASLLQLLSIAEIHYINDIIDCIKQSADRCLFIPRLQPGEVEVQCVMDASLAGRVDQSSQGARAIGLTTRGTDSFAPVDVSSRKVRRRGSSSFDVELLTLVDCADMALIVGLVVEELRYGIRPSLAQRIYLEVEGLRVLDTKTKITIDTDAKDSVERIYSLKDSLGVSKRRRTDISDMQELLVYLDITEFRHVHGGTNPMDCLTKKYGRFGLSKNKASYLRFLELLYSGIYVADVTAAERGSKLQSVKCRYFGCCPTSNVYTLG